MLRALLLLLVFLLAVILFGVAADDQNVDWLTLFAVAILSWLAIAIAVGTVIGHGIAFGTGSDSG